MTDDYFSLQALREKIGDGDFQPDDRGGRHLLGLADAAQGRFRLDLRAKTVCDAASVKTFGFHHAGVDGVDANLSRPKFLGQRLCHRIHRRLRGAVN